MDNAKPIAAIDLRDGATLPLRKDEDGETTEPADAAPRPAIDPEKLAAASKMVQPKTYDAEKLAALLRKKPLAFDTAWTSTARLDIKWPLPSVFVDPEWVSKINASIEISKLVARRAGQVLGRLYANTTLDEVKKVMHRTSTRMENNYQALSNAGYSEEEIDGLDSDGVLFSTARVASALQCKVGYCPVGDALAERLRGRIAAAKREDSSKNMGCASNLADIKYRRLRDFKTGLQPLTVDEAAQLAIAYGITTAELLGFMDADEVRLLRLWRGMSAESRDAIYGLMEQLSAQSQHNS